MYKIGDKIKCIGYEGLYEIIASKDKPKQVAGSIIPPTDFEFALKRIDGQMEGSFEPYKFVKASMIDKV